MKSSELLKQKIDAKAESLKNNFHGSSYWAVQSIVRRIDYILPLFLHKEGWNKKDVDDFREFFKYGWAPLLKYYYSDLDPEVHLTFPLMSDELILWTDSNILLSGKIELCNRIITCEKANLLTIQETSENKFAISYIHELSGIEVFDQMSRNFMREQIVERLIADKKKIKEFDEEKIKRELRKIIKCPDGKMISYISTPEIDEYYSQQGLYHILRLQGYDDFDPEDEFGGIKYSKYIDLIELITGAALMHLDACLELYKMNPQINLMNILSYTYYHDKTIELYSNYLGAPKEEVEQLFSCITLSKENFSYYLEYSATAPPMYLQVSNNLTIRSIAGCLSNPFSLLNKELKRKYRSDYDEAVNRRENRFRKELFDFFPQERIVKIPNGINISFNGIKTDIDAVVFDKKTETLGLFQLKWQDPFAYDMKERFSRMTNLFPKANEWVRKMKQWVTSNTSQTIIHSLQINRFIQEKVGVKDVCVFVISRNQMNFTGMDIEDDSVAWSSWHQLIESQTKFEMEIDDPIIEMFVKIKSFSPEKRSRLEAIPKLQDLNIQIDELNIYIQKD